MGHAVFIDRIGKIFDGNYDEAIDNYERYKDYSQQGIGRFADKNVYMLDGSGQIVKSFGSTKFETGGAVAERVDVIKNFILGKKINQSDLGDDFFVLESSVLIYKTQGGQYPLISKENNTFTFHKSNFPSSDYINSLLEKFRDVCIKNANRFEVK
ncbi:MAG: hypothetical protein IPJ01_11725 [Micavibrio sp.]|nr:hypothetical protein [Micavibrio sp.]